MPGLGMEGEHTTRKPMKANRPAKRRAWMVKGPGVVSR